MSFKDDYISLVKVTVLVRFSASACGRVMVTRPMAVVSSMYSGFFHHIRPQNANSQTFKKTHSVSQLSAKSMYDMTIIDPSYQRCYCIASSGCQSTACFISRLEIDILLIAFCLYVCYINFFFFFFFLEFSRENIHVFPVSALKMLGLVGRYNYFIILYVYWTFHLFSTIFQHI